MQNNYYFIRQLVIELNSLLPGYKLADAYSQNKDEAIFNFFKEGNEFNLIAHLTGQFTCLAFPGDYAKAKKNTATIFAPLVGQSVISVKEFINERAFSISFGKDFVLVFKLFGRQANLVLLQNDKVIELFKKGHRADLELSITNLNREIDQSKDKLLEVLPNVREVYPTLHKKMVVTIETATEGLSKDQAAETILEIIENYQNPSGYTINTENGKPALEICQGDASEEVINSAIEASTLFFFQYLKFKKQTQLKNQLLQDIDKKIARTEVYLSKVRRKLQSIEHDTNYKLMADLLMANLHAVPANTEYVDLPDFYNEGKTIHIKLNAQLSPQQNAERYYRKSKNIKLEIDNLKATIQTKEDLLSSLKARKSQIEEADDLKSLKSFSAPGRTKKPERDVPFKTFIIGGYTVYVGNNAKQNDLLTLKYASKNDLFFHAKDVSGSHVILKQQAGSNVPARVLEATASLAAYYSKRKTDSLCPVGYTEKKYVRKPKGSPPGLVLVDREKVLLVPPQLPEAT